MPDSETTTEQLLNDIGTVQTEKPLEEEISENKKTAVRKWGGPQEGAGRPKGKVSQKTLDKLKVLRAMKERIMRSADQLLNSQMNLAQGVSYLYVIRTNSKGFKEKPELITSQFTIEAYLAGELEDEDNEYYYITTERPDNKALDSLFDRTFGKAPVIVQGGDKPIEVKLMEEKRYAAIIQREANRIIDGTIIHSEDSGAEPVS